MSKKPARQTAVDHEAATTAADHAVESVATIESQITEVAAHENSPAVNSASGNKPTETAAPEAGASDAPARPLLHEVQAFLAKRVELAKRVAEEIDATEKKLAELRKTAALLQAETAPTPPKVKSPKKARVKPHSAALGTSTVEGSVGGP